MSVFEEEVLLAVMVNNPWNNTTPSVDEGGGGTDKLSVWKTT